MRGVNEVAEVREDDKKGRPRGTEVKEDCVTVIKHPILHPRQLPTYLRNTIFSSVVTYKYVI